MIKKRHCRMKGCQKELWMLAVFTDDYHFTPTNRLSVYDVVNTFKNDTLPQDAR